MNPEGRVRQQAIGETGVSPVLLSSKNCADAAEPIYRRRPIPSADKKGLVYEAFILLWLEEADLNPEGRVRQQAIGETGVSPVLPSGKKCVDAAKPVYRRRPIPSADKKGLLLQQVFFIMTGTDLFVVC